MLKQKIQEHNYLNGYLFVVIEFGVFIMVILPFTLYYILHGKIWPGIIGLGLIVNFIPMLFFALRSLLRKEKSIGIHKIYNKMQRDDIKERFPNLSLDTLVLLVCLIIPFLLVIALCIELLGSNKPV